MSKAVGVAVAVMAVCAIGGLAYMGWRSGLEGTGQVIAVEGSAGSRELTVMHASCGEAGHFDVNESADEVVLTIRLEKAIRGECDAPLTVSKVLLDDVLGDRDVVDGPTRTVVPVTGR